MQISVEGVFRRAARTRAPPMFPTPMKPSLAPLKTLSFIII